MWLKDIHVNEDTRVNLPTSFYGLHQMISRPRHMLANPSLCIYLIFISQLNFIVDCGVHPSLHSNCHHQNTYSELNVITEYPPPYHRLVWDFRNAKYMSLMKVVNIVNWEFLFSKINVHEQVSVFINTLMNIFSNYIPNRYVTFNSKDPAWPRKEIKKKSLNKINYVLLVIIIDCKYI